MKQLTIYKLDFWTVMFFLSINFDLFYCYDISLENFTESTFFTFFGGWGGANKVQSYAFFDSPSCVSHSKFQHAIASTL